jgi:ketosteroid isomerase-like protein
MLTLRRFTTICLVLLVVAAALASGCSRQTEEDKVKKVITDAQTAVEEKEIRKVVNALADTYSDPQGFNREGIRRVLLGYFLAHPKIAVYLTYLRVSVDGASARAAFQTVLTSGKKTGSPADVIPESLGVYRFDVSLNKISGDWKVTSASWERIGEE